MADRPRRSTLSSIRTLARRLCVTEGQPPGKTIALSLIPGLPTSDALVGDRAYDAKGVMDAARANGTPTHPSQQYVRSRVHPA